jgi:hypothetical protein
MLIHFKKKVRDRLCIGELGVAGELLAAPLNTLILTYWLIQRSNSR